MTADQTVADTTSDSLRTETGLRRACAAAIMALVAVVIASGAALFLTCAGWLVAESIRLDNDAQLLISIAIMASGIICLVCCAVFWSVVGYSLLSSTHVKKEATHA